MSEQKPGFAIPLSEDAKQAIRDVCDGLAIVYGIPPLEKYLLAGQIGEIVLIEGYRVMQECLAQTAEWTRELLAKQREEFVTARAIQEPP